MPQFTHLIIIPNSTNVTFVLLKSLTHKDCLHEQHLENLPLLFFSLCFLFCLTVFLLAIVPKSQTFVSFLSGLEQWFSRISEGLSNFFFGHRLLFN